MSDGTFTAQPVSLVPVYHWRGARPRLLDLNRDQTGWGLFLVFSREGDCRLLPLAWACEQPDPEGDPWHPPLPFARSALDAAAMALVKAELEAEGWEVTGRLRLSFTGCAAESYFWQQLLPYLKEEEAR